MGFDDLAEDIRERMEEGILVTAEDFEGRPCAYCGELIDFVDWPDNVVTWDVRVQEPGRDEPDPYVHRFYFCSESCKSAYERSEEHLQGDASHGEFDEIHVDELDDAAPTTGGGDSDV